MAGHSKWKQIKHKKAIADSKRAQKFTKLIKEISVAARVGGGDPNGNPRLRFLLEKARDINMPLENSMRAIKKGTGELPGAQYEAYQYEGYGPGGIAVIIDVLTDNKNKAIAELRHVFSRKGGHVAESGAVSWMFERMGVIRTEPTSLSEDKLIEQLMKYDIKDISREDDNSYEIICDPRSLDDVKQAAANMGLKVTESELEWVPKTAISLSEESEEKAVDFLQAIEELEDVQNVYANLA
ncbi:MAG TPA: YebC/PmpR family DNA-binding transcriptional regulator [Candidatus Babeliaceae bacterium]|nr:YebC/PmpR family DNA-binding transcriptional regulator [Candidatus Babeliaceae bacterium]